MDVISARVAQPPANQLAIPDRPSASDYPEVEESIDLEDMRMAVTALAFQPYRGETGRSMDGQRVWDFYG